MNLATAATQTSCATKSADVPDVGTRSLSVLELCLLALLLAGANAMKPLHIDDTAYYAYARQIAAHPLDPYGFSVFWYERWEPAQQVLAPPVLPYWWAAAVKLFGDRPILWKLWLFPFCLMLAWALADLFERFAANLARPLVWMTVLSPVFLPSLNLMLDIPALALGLAALVLFMRALERSSVVGAVVGGLVAGLSMQTKYTGLLLPAVFFVYAVAHSEHGWFRNLGRWLLASSAAGLVFAGWEGFLIWRYPAAGSHFLYHLREAGSDPLWSRLGESLLALPALVGSMSAVIGLLGLLALSRRRWLLAIGALWIALSYISIACIGARFTARAHLHPWWGAETLNLSGRFPLEAIVFGGLGAAAIAILILVCWHLVRDVAAGPKGPFFWQAHPLDWFLIGWFVVEVGGYFALSPFPATRRLMGVVVVATLLAGRLASTVQKRTSIRQLVWALAACNIGLGGLYFFVDFGAAQAEQTGAVEAATWIQRQDRAGKVWFTGHWGFQFYAEQAGMRPVVAGQTWLNAGDWLVLPDAGVVQQDFTPNLACLEKVQAMSIWPLLPVTTVADEFGGYYGTNTGAPLLHQDSPQLQVSIYRVRRAHLCRWLGED
jgi:hypothetical protein